MFGLRGETERGGESRSINSHSPVGNIKCGEGKGNGG